MYYTKKMKREMKMQIQKAISDGKVLFDEPDEVLTLKMIQLTHEYLLELIPLVVARSMGIIKEAQMRTRLSTPISRGVS